MLYLEKLISYVPTLTKKYSKPMTHSHILTHTHWLWPHFADTQCLGRWWAGVFVLHSQ